MHSIKHSALFRQQLLIDKRVQGALLRRTALYCGCSAVYFITILIFTESVSYPNQTLIQSVLHCLNEMVYWAPGLLLMSPLVLWDLLTVTNRFAGPVFRLQREMQRLIDGEPTTPLTFREGDYWTEMAVAFNQIRDEMLEHRGDPPAAGAESDTDGESDHLKSPDGIQDAEASAGPMLV